MLSGLGFFYCKVHKSWSRSRCEFCSRISFVNGSARVLDVSINSDDTFDLLLDDFSDGFDKSRVNFSKKLFGVDE